MDLGAATALASIRYDQLIVQSLMISFPMIVGDELYDGLSEMLLAERNQPVETFFFDRPHEPLRVRIRIRRALGGEHNANASLAHPTPHIPAPFLIPIANQELRRGRRTRLGHRQCPDDPLHEHRLWMRR